MAQEKWILRRDRKATPNKLPSTSLPHRIDTAGTILAGNSAHDFKRG